MRKTRKRLFSGLAALAALLLTPLAEASLTRAASPAAERPALELALTAPVSEPSEFSLFEGNELTAAADESSSAPGFHPLAAVSLLSKDGAEGSFVSVAEESYPKTRYRVFELLGARIIGVERGVTLTLDWGCADFSCGLTSGTVGWLSQDPMEDRDSPNLYGFVGGRPHEATDPMGTCAELDDIPCGEYLKEFGDQFLFQNLWETTKRSGRFLLGEGKGALKAVPNLVKATAQVAAHPVRTIQALGTAAGEAIADPAGTARRAGNALLNADPDKAAEFVGETLALSGLGAAAKTTEGAAALSKLKSVASAFSFNDLTEAAGAGIADYSAEVTRAGAAGGVASAAPSATAGSFSISSWRGYPSRVPRPSGPFRLLEGEELAQARQLADRTNQSLRRQLAKDFPNLFKNAEIHEIHPVKFGGSPTDLSNKVLLPRGVHQTEVTPWWRRLQDSLTK